MIATATKRCACGKSISENKDACYSCLSTARAGDGVLEILNVQGGDVKITFDKDHHSESIRARRIVQDMLRRGYALIVEVERKGKKCYERVKEFDADRGEYIVADFDSLEAARVDASVPLPPQEPLTVALKPGECVCGRHAKHRGACRGARKTKRLAMENTKAVGIGRSAGG